MSKLYIAKNRYGKYYAKIQNKYNNCEKIISVNLPEGVELQNSYGLYECDYFLTCFKKSNGEVELAIKVTRIPNSKANVVNPDVNPLGAQSVNAYADYENTTEDLPF